MLPRRFVFPFVLILVAPLLSSIPVLMTYQANRADFRNSPFDSSGPFMFPMSSQIEDNFPGSKKPRPPRTQTERLKREISEQKSHIDDVEGDLMDYKRRLNEAAEVVGKLNQKIERLDRYAFVSTFAPLIGIATAMFVALFTFLFALRTDRRAEALLEIERLKLQLAEAEAKLRAAPAP